MPHQCLGCGHLFAEGSSAVLAGCPECKGTRFFYTKEAVPEEERKRIGDQAQKDLRNVVADLLKAQAPETAQELVDKADSDGWASLKPKDVRRLIRAAQKEKKQAAKEDGAVAPGHATVQQLRADDEDVEAKPDTVTVTAPGEYEIDVKGLLERNPIVVHKDGTYLIHLPSLFARKQA